MGKTKKVIGLANRFRVYRFMKAYMDEFMTCPSVAQVAEETNMSTLFAQRHMQALRDADGIDCEVPIPRYSHLDAVDGGLRKLSARNARAQELDDGGEMVPVDLAMVV